MGPPPIVTGISPKEAAAGTRITIRGENLGVSQQDLLGVLIHGFDCLLTTEWKSPNKLTALCPGAAKEGSGDIVVATRSGGLGSCTVRLRVFKEPIGPLKEVACWTQEKFFTRRKNRAFSASGGGGAGLDQEDALGLSVEGNELKLPEERLRQAFPGMCGDVGAENFEPAYYLLENHHGTTFEDLKAGLLYLRRKVDGENKSQLSFIKANISSIMDQLDTLKEIKKLYEKDREYDSGRTPTERVEKAIASAKREADQMFVDVLGRKDRADATRNALSVLHRFKFLFNLPANIENNLAKGDYDRIIDEYERAKSLYGGSESDIFNIYLTQVEKRVETLKEKLQDQLENPDLEIEAQKRLIANLVQLNVEGDPAWHCLDIKYRHLLNELDSCRDEYLSRHRQNRTEKQQQYLLSPSSKNLPLFPCDGDEEERQHDSLPETVLFVQDATAHLEEQFPDLWRLGQSYFKGELVVSPDATRQSVFKDMILGGIQYFSNLIRAAIIPQTLPEDGGRDQFGDWGGESGGADENAASGGDRFTANWLPSCLRTVRRTHASFVEVDLPGQALDIIKRLTTDLRIQCLQMIFQTVIDQVHALHEKEEWVVETTDEFGAVTEMPEMFERLVSQSVQLIKEALLSTDSREEDILAHETAHSDLELLIQNVLSSFAFALENAAVENYASLGDSLPSDSTRLLLCRNNCRFTLTHVLPKIQKSFQEVGQLSLERPIAEACKGYHVLDGKLFEAYLELKCDPVVAMIEPSMYVGKFDWARCPKPADARDYVKEILHNVISVHCEVDRVSATTKKGSTEESSSTTAVLKRVVASVAEEVNRLFCCISRMNSNGCIQAWVDIHCLQTALKHYLTEAADNFLSDAAKPLYDLERPGDREIIQTCIAEFNKRMKFHLVVLKMVQ